MFKVILSKQNIFELNSTFKRTKVFGSNEEVLYAWNVKK